ADREFGRDDRQLRGRHAVSLPHRIDIRRYISHYRCIELCRWESVMTDLELREQVRERYAAAAVRVSLGSTNGAEVAADGCCGPTDVAESSACCSTGSCAPESVDVDDTFGAALYTADEQSELPPEALAASLGCGNPLAVAELRAGERVLDLGSGGGIDVLLSARRGGGSRVACRGEDAR